MCLLLLKQGSMDNYYDVSSIYMASWLQSCPLVKFTDCSWFRGSIKLIITTQVYRGKGMKERSVHRDPCCSPVSRSAACMENWPAVIATFAQLKTPLSSSSPSMPQFFSFHFNPNQKINISLPLFAIQIIFHPQPYFTGSCSQASLCCDTPKKTVLLNVVDEQS